MDVMAITSGETRFHALRPHLPLAKPLQRICTPSSLSFPIHIPHSQNIFAEEHCRKKGSPPRPSHRHHATRPPLALPSRAVLHPRDLPLRVARRPCPPSCRTPTDERH